MDFLHIIERFRTILKTSLGREKVYDRDIARALNLDPQYFAVIKRRNRIPFESIAHFCHNENISMNWILFGSEAAQYGTKKITA